MEAEAKSSHRIDLSAQLHKNGTSPLRLSGGFCRSSRPALPSAAGVLLSSAGHAIPTLVRWLPWVKAS